MPADLQYMYEKILAAAGGADNISALGCCMTRLRFTVKDEALVDVEAPVSQEVLDVLSQIPGVTRVRAVK